MKVELVRRDSVHPRIWAITVTMLRIKVIGWNIVRAYLPVTQMAAIIPVT